MLFLKGGVQNVSVIMDVLVKVMEDVLFVIKIPNGKKVQANIIDFVQILNVKKHTAKNLRSV